MSEMKERKLIELISLPEPEAARFELRPDGGRTLILEMGLLTEDEGISMDIGLIRRSPVQLIAVRLYPSSQDDIVMLYMVQLDQDPPNGLPRYRQCTSLSSSKTNYWKKKWRPMPPSMQTQFESTMAG